MKRTAGEAERHAQSAAERLQMGSSQTRSRRRSLNVDHTPAWRLPFRKLPHDLSATAAKLKQRAKGDFKGRYYEAALIIQAVSRHLRYPLSYRDTVIQRVNWTPLCVLSA